MRRQLAQKTTQAPVSLSGSTSVTNEFIDGYYSYTQTGLGIQEMTLSPTVQRYAGGESVPDRGYYYDPIDYSVAAIIVTNGITILPGTVVAFRNDFLAGFFLQNGSSFRARGVPTNPVIFTDIQFVQEGPLQPGLVLQWRPPQSHPWIDLDMYTYGGIDFICPQAGVATTNIAPTLDLEFCNFYMTTEDQAIWGGTFAGYPGLGYSFACSVYLTMQNCDLMGGGICLGPPLECCEYPNWIYPSGSVVWRNNAFESVEIALSPSFTTTDGSGNDGTVNVDLSFYAGNNLFKGGQIGMTPVMTSSGNWIFNNNLFDQVEISQYAADLNAQYNGYWLAPDGSQLTNSDSSTLTDQFLTGSPPYEAGPFGKYYTAPNSRLSGAGSTNANLLGQYFYTTKTSQVLAAASNADIGLYYVAAATNNSGIWVPLVTNGMPCFLADVDGNGIIPSSDPNNAVYANVDFDGDGMVGIIESNLLKNPLAADNPLALTNVSFSSDSATFVVGVSSTLISGLGKVVLMVDGNPAATNQSGSGSAQLVWNTTGYAVGKTHYLQAHLILTGSTNFADGPLLAFNIPSVTVQPPSQTNGIGGTSVFTASSLGSGPYTYQWFDGTTNINGATNSTLTINDLSVASSGTYTLYVTNAQGDFVGSSSATLVVSNIYIGITTQPMSQSIFEPDSVTFAVTALGTNLTYQWGQVGGDGTFSPISGATGSNYTVSTMNPPNVTGPFEVLISSVTTVGTNSVTNCLFSSTATLTDFGNVAQDWPVLPVVGPRQNYTFQSGTTYLVGFPLASGVVDLYGDTVIQGGTVIKFDYDLETNDATLVLHGNLNCTAGAYRPAMLTSMDDDSEGEAMGNQAIEEIAGITPAPGYWSDGQPRPARLGTTYLNLDDVQNALSITNLRVSYADNAITVPTNSGSLQLWNSQFYACNTGINGAPCAATTNGLHNVLFADCYLAVTLRSAYSEVDAEQVTANVGSFCDPEYPLSRLGVTNSIILGEIGASSEDVLVDVVTPSGWPFQSVNDGNYYLPAGSPYHNAGSTSISLGMQAELPKKTTYAPISFPSGMAISGQMTLFPQITRCTNTAPDLGFCYDALDYTIGDMYLSGGTVTVLRGTAIGFRNDFFGCIGLANNSLFTGQGTPTQPIIFADNSLVQEGPFAPGLVYNQWWGESWISYGFVASPYGGQAFFMPAAAINDTNDVAPQLNLRFCDFYMTADNFAVEAGVALGSEGYPLLGSDGAPLSPSSSVVLNLQDCSLYGGQIVLGTPFLESTYESDTNPPGSVSWVNDLFQGTFIVLAPGAGGNGPYVDLSFQAYNNLFKGGVLDLQTITSSQGPWVMNDNLFDGMVLRQDSGTFSHDCNGYWTNDVPFNMFMWMFGGPEYEFFSFPSDEVLVTNALPYQIGALGNYYLPTNTQLYQKGSRTNGAAGLCQYTTTTNQTKYLGAQMVDIGLHYVAASNSAAGWVPLDTDGDGIPDYVEDAMGNNATGSTALSLNETDWTNPMSDGVNHDSSNAVYMNIDLDGDGLAGGMELALECNPLIAGNPLNLAQIITGQEPDIVTFKVFTNYTFLTNLGSIELWMDGGPGPLVQMPPQSGEGGEAIISWNTTFDAPGQHFLQARLNCTSIDLSLTPRPITVAAGPILVFDSSNAIQFDPYYCDFSGNGATLFAQAAVGTQYSIQLVSPGGEYVYSTSGTVTEEPSINKFWGATNADGSAYTNDWVLAMFSIMPPGASSSEAHPLVLFGNGLGLNDGDFTVAYSWNTMSGIGGILDQCIGLGAVNTLMTPDSAGAPNPNCYNSTFNLYGDPIFFSGGDAGYISDANDINNLLQNLSTTVDYRSGVSQTRDFYWYGEGSESAINIQVNKASITANQVRLALSNYPSVYVPGPIGIFPPFPQGPGTWTTPITVHPYRFVFLDCCYAGADSCWAQAFGIFGHSSFADVSGNPERACAFLGWNGEVANVYGSDECQEYSYTLSLFFELWQGGSSLDECVQACSRRGSPGPPLDPYNQINITFPLGLPKSSFALPPTRPGAAPNPLPGAYISYYGYPGLTRLGFAPE